MRVVIKKHIEFVNVFPDTNYKSCREQVQKDQKLGKSSLLNPHEIDASEKKMFERGKGISQRTGSRLFRDEMQGVWLWGNCLFPFGPNRG